jgi:hypothetical protein
MIIAAAIRYAHGEVLSLPPPARHADIERIATSAEPWVHGFLTENGEFLERSAAMRHARACRQLLPRVQPADPIGSKPRISSADQLFSEDLW